MIHTAICELLGIRYPVLQGGMAWVSDASLAGAVSNAGGLGIIAAMNADGDYLREQIRQTRALTDKPFGVNIMLMSPYAPDVAQVALDEKVPVITTGAGLPSQYIRAWVQAGIRVLPVVPSVAIARMVQRMGAHAVIAEGGESGGHIGELNTMALVPQVVDAVDIPVIAAGGIGDGRGMAAALMLGACGVQMGTRFLVAHECAIHETYKEKIIKAKDIDTLATGRRLGHPVRALKNPFTRAFYAKEYDAGVSDQELEAYGAGALRLAAREGDAQKGCFMAGQIAGLVQRRQSAAEIINEVTGQAETLLRGACQWVK
ncbi:MAG: nitronate monooxygenase [Eubacteriales bacterium]|nr:nitronate monooxygenase [Eubacteriales bacterium]